MLVCHEEQRAPPWAWPPRWPAKKRQTATPGGSGAAFCALLAAWREDAVFWALHLLARERGLNSSPL